MLARANRITHGRDYRGTVRRGAKFVGPNTVTYIRASDSSDARFGFIVAKSVGIAVVRNRVRRRLKAASYSLLPQVAPGYDVVELPPIPTAAVLTHRGDMPSIGRSWMELMDQLVADGYRIVGPTREIYVDAESPDQSTWVTELVAPVEKV